MARVVDSVNDDVENEPWRVLSIGDRDGEGSGFIQLQITVDELFEHITGFIPVLTLPDGRPCGMMFAISVLPERFTREKVEE